MTWERPALSKWPKGLVYPIFALSVTSSLVGCGASPTPERHGYYGALYHPRASQDNPYRSEHYRESAAYYLELAQMAIPPQSYELELKAADILVDGGKMGRAFSVLGDIPTDIDADLLAHRQVLLAEIALSRHENKEALQLLNTLDGVGHIPPQLLKRAHIIKAQAYARQGQVLESARIRVLAAPYFTDAAEKQANHEAIWAALNKLSAHAIKMVHIAPPPNAWGGWLSLAYITKQYDTTPDELAQALMAWQKAYPSHPARQFLPNSIHRAIKEAAATPVSQVALLLPLEGPHQQAASAIRDGFMSAYYDAQHKPTVKVYDATNPEAVRQLYQQAITDGADVVVGPLTKEGVKQLARLPENALTVPTIALNALPEAMSAPNRLYQFSLDPEAEARSVAEQVHSDGYQRAAVVVTNAALGQRSLAAFRESFAALGGAVLSAVAVDVRGDQAPSIRQLLHIDQSEKRYQGIKKLLRRTTEFQPRRREDIDVVVLVAPPQQARQLRPLFDFYYAQSLPIYGTSSIYAGYPSPKKDRDMNSVAFCDMPWLLDKNHALSQTRDLVRQLWPDEAEEQARFFAMGLDAYSLVNHMGRLMAFPNLGLPGATGTLTLGANQKIERRLSWAKIHNGVPKLLHDKSG